MSTRVPCDRTITESVDQIQSDETYEMCAYEPDPIDSEVDTMLFGNRIIWVDGDIDDMTVSKVCKRIMMFNLEDAGLAREFRRPIYLFIRSDGGDADCAFSIIGTIRASGTEVRTINMGPCDSAAGLIFMAGKKRFMLPYATVLIHDGEVSIDGTMHSVLDVTESCKRWLDQMYSYISRQTQISLRTLQQYGRQEWRLDAKECLEYGVCTNIINSIEEVFS